MTNNLARGGRFRKPLDQRVASFNASIAFDYFLYPYDILASKAHAIMLAKQGLISSDEANTICTALTEIQDELTQNIHNQPFTAEDIHMFIEQLLIEKIGDTGKKLHTGRSRNDQIATDMRLYTRDSSVAIKKLLQNFCKLLNRLAQKHQNDIMPGYTHLQQAQPISLGTYFDAYHAMFKRDLSRLKDWDKRMNFCPLGAGALAGSTLPLDRQFVAHTLGFDGIIKNTVDAVSNRDYVIEFCGIASIIMMHLSRLSEDLILWATQEFNFLTLNDAFSTGSSLMPNKKNPDVLELTRGKSGRVFGHLVGILTVMKALPLSYNKDMQEDKEGLRDVVKTLTSCLEVITPFLESTQFNTEVMNKSAKSGYLDATRILESLVLQGIPFRDAHHLVGSWVIEAIEKGVTLQEIMRQNT